VPVSEWLDGNWVYPAIAGLALLVDRLLPEPRRHPIIRFGHYAAWLERRMNRGRAAEHRSRGIWAVMAAVLPPTLVAVAIEWLPPLLGLPLMLAVVVLALGARSLGEHGRRVANALAAEDLPAARAATSQLVSRDTRRLDAEGCARATTESILENGNDAVIGTIFWFLIGGAGGVVAYRLINTLDAMWGYRSHRYRLFGWAAARLDDIVNFVPARVTAVGYRALGYRQSALRAWR